MLVSPDDLKTELYPEIVQAITRSNPEEVKTQIKAAEAFCKSYLFKYDLNVLLLDTTFVIRLFSCFFHS